jgi:hypothetical protein
MRAVATAAGALALVLAVLLVASAASASTPRAPAPAAARTAFGHFLRQLYGPVRGYWTCPHQDVPSAIDDCLGEVRAEGRWHQVGAEATNRQGEIDFGRVFAWTWTRHWSPYSRHFILRSREPQVPGVISVNSNAFDWGFLAQGLGHLTDGGHATRYGYDGAQGGWSRFYTFRCSRKGELITCRNSLGDAMRYRPKG